MYGNDGKIILKMMSEVVSSYYNKIINKGDVFMGKIDRTGEERYNSFGSKIIIKKYRGCMDIDVYFPEYDWTFEHARYDNFKNGNINVLTKDDIMESVIWEKVNIKYQKMVN